MTKVRKTRFTVLSDGVDKQLFSVEERASGDLTLVLRHAANFDDSSERFAIAGQRYSVHNSPRSPGFTLKHTISRKCGGEVTSVQHALPGPDGKAAVLFYRTVPDLTPDRYNLKLRSREVIRRLYDCDINYRKDTLFYFVFITEPGIDLSRCAHRMHLTTMNFRNFQLCVSSGLFFVPAMPGADLFHCVTSQPRYKTDAAVVPLVPPTPCPPLSVLLQHMEANIHALADAALERCGNLTAPDGTKTNPVIMAKIKERLRVYRTMP